MAFPQPSEKEATWNRSRGRDRRFWFGRGVRSGASPCGDGEAGTDQDCDDTAQAPPRSGLVGENEGGYQSEVEPHRAAQAPQYAPAGSAACGEHSGQREHGDVLGVVRPPTGESSLVGPADLPGKGDRCCDEKYDCRQRGENEEAAGRILPPGGEAPNVPPVRVGDQRGDGDGED